MKEKKPLLKQNHHLKMQGEKNLNNLSTEIPEKIDKKK